MYRCTGSQTHFLATQLVIKFDVWAKKMAPKKRLIQMIQKIV